MYKSSEARHITFMNTNARHLNQVAETHMRAQCPSGHWNLVRLVLDRSLTKQVAVPTTCKCGKAV